MRQQRQQHETHIGMTQSNKEKITWITPYVCVWIVAFNVIHISRTKWEAPEIIANQAPKPKKKKKEILWEHVTAKCVCTEKVINMIPSMC